MDFINVMLIKMMVMSLMGLALIILDKPFKRIKARSRCYIWFVLMVAMLIPVGLVEVKVSENSLFANIAVNEEKQPSDDNTYMRNGDVAAGDIVGDEADSASSNGDKYNDTTSNNITSSDTATNEVVAGNTATDIDMSELSNSGAVVPPMGDNAVHSGAAMVEDNIYTDIESVDIGVLMRYGLGVIWALGAVGFLMLNYIGYFSIAKKCRNCRKEEACGITYFVSTEVNTPFTIGIFKKRIILPDREYSKEYLNMILKHEMIHVKQHDTDGKLITMLVNALLWFNPIVWLMRKRYNRDIELACDERMVADMSQSERISYGELLYSEAKDNSKFAYGTFFSAKGELTTRIKNVVNTTTKKKGYILILAAIVVGLVFLLSFTIKNDNSASDNEPQSGDDIAVVTTTAPEPEEAFMVVNQLNGLKPEYDEALQQKLLKLLAQAQVSEPEIIDDIESDYRRLYNAHMIAVASGDERTEYYIAENYNYFYVKRYSGSGVVTEKHSDVDITYIDKLYEIIYWADRKVGNFNYENYTGYLDECYYYYGFKDFVNKDYDCDGLIDRICRNEDISYRIEFGNGEVLEIDRALWPGTILELYSADLNNDGRPEIVFVNDTESYISNNPYPTVDLAVYEWDGDGYKEMGLPFRGEGVTAPKVAIDYEYQGDKTYKIFVEGCEEPFVSTMTGQNWVNGEYAYLSDLNLPTNYQGLKDVYIKRDSEGDKLVVVHRAFNKGSGALIELTLGYDNGLVIEDGMLWEDGAQVHYKSAINLIEGYETGCAYREGAYGDYLYIRDLNTSIESYYQDLDKSIEYSAIKQSDSLSEWKLDSYEGSLISFEEYDGVGRSIYEYTYNDRTGYYVIYGMDGKAFIHKIIFPLNITKEQMEVFVENIRFYSTMFD